MPGRALILVALALLAACGGRETPGAASAPAGDIILVTIDTWRADSAGFAGNSAVKTPFLDSLAARGIVFTNAHAHNVITLPSHTNILTGLNPYQHGVRENAGFKLDPAQVTVAERLHDQGYATGAFVAAFPLDARFGLNQGFDVYDDNYGKGSAKVQFTIQERRASAVLEPAVRWWQSVQGRKRFLWVHLYDPHAPYMPEEPFLSQYAGNRYLGEVASVDDALARHLGPIIGSDTTVIVTADHGEALGDHGETSHGLFAYEATLKVPMIVAGPEVKARREAQYVRHIDIAPTILQRAGIDPPKDLPGQSLLGTITPQDTYFEALTASLDRGWAPLTGLIRAGSKYIDLPLPELYELAPDPGEKNNLYTERRRAVAAARQVLAGLQLAPKRNRTLSAEEVARLRSLGYVAGQARERAVTAADDPKNLVHIDRKIHDVIDSFQRGDLQSAVRMGREIVAEQPRMASGRELLATVLQESERIDEAIEVLGRLVADGDASDAARVQFGLLLSETGKAQDAEAILAPLAAQEPTAQILNGYGTAIAEQGRPREAVEQFRRAIALDPNHAPSYQNIGIVALRMNDVQTAQNQLTRALELNPKLPLALNALGVVYARQNQYDRAIDAWKRSVALDRKQYDALFNIGLVAARTGQTGEARQALSEFVRTAPPRRYAADLAAARQALSALR